MIKIYTEDRVITSTKKIITTVNETDRELIVPNKSTSKSMDRRQFMMYSVVLAGTMIFPTKAEAWIWWLIRPAIRIAIAASRTGTVVRAGRTGINLANRGTRQGRRIEVEKATTSFKASAGLSLNPVGLLHAGEAIAGGDAKIIWDRDGHHVSPKTGEVFKNIAWLRIQNKSNQYIETKIKLALLTGGDRTTFKRQYTLKLNPGADEKVDVSHIYRGLDRSGVQYVIYDVLTHRNAIRVSSPNENIYVTNLIV